MPIIFHTRLRHRCLDQQIKFSDPNVLAGHGGTLAVSSGFTISNGPVHIFGDDDDAVGKYAPEHRLRQSSF